ncbi:MAG: hypothetical protein COA79_22040 [Planctomycetota bacterium]|nr:MAG: hypothetical protein COA79_22040 [Planctomycetota bacterium]
MAIAIEGYTVVAKKSRINQLIKKKLIEAPNSTSLDDNNIWRCCFMAKSDALEFIEKLEKLDLNASQGPDSDVVLVDEFDRIIEPYCEWLITAVLHKSFIAWKEGTDPDSITALKGWNPKIGSGLISQNQYSDSNLEFLRLDENVEVFIDKSTGKEVYIGRTSDPIDSMFATASKVIEENFVSAGEPRLKGEYAKTVLDALKTLETIISKEPNSWKTNWYLGKGHLALGNLELSYKYLLNAIKIEKTEEIILRELVGVCLELSKFNEAIEYSESSAILAPDNIEILGNLSISYLLAGKIKEANKTISSAIKLNPKDKINQTLHNIIVKIEKGEISQPKNFIELMNPKYFQRSPFWKFW